MTWSAIFRLVVMSLTFALCVSENTTVTQRLLKALLANYDNRLMPIQDPNGQVLVFVKFLLGRIESLDEKQQTLTSFGWLIAVWHDELLQWDPRHYGGIKRLVLPASTVWLPEMAMLNSVDQGDDLTFESKFRVSLFADGTVMWSPGMKWKTACRVDLTYFPFDRQSCNISFVNWVYSVEELEFTVVSPIFSNVPNASLRLYEPNAEWTVTAADAIKDYVTVDNISFQPTIHLSIELTRKPRYFLFNILIPCIIITVLSVLVYWLPCESGEKISLAVTVLLSYTVLLLIVSDVSPRNGDSLPLLTCYLLFGMIMTGLSLLGAVWSLSIHYQPPNRRVSGAARAFFLRFLSRCFCSNTKEVGRSTYVDGSTAHDVKTPQRKSTENNDSTEYMRMRLEKMAVMERTEKIQEEWQLYARNLDCCNLLVFSILIVAATICLLTTIAGFGQNIADNARV